MDSVMSYSNQRQMYSCRCCNQSILDVVEVILDIVTNSSHCCFRKFIGARKENLRSDIKVLVSS